MLWVAIDKTSGMPLTKQVCEQLRSKILSRDLPPGTKLPSSRKFAQEMQISRNVVIYAYEQLIAEGFLESQEGSGTYVAEGSYLEQYKEVAQEQRQQAQIRQSRQPRDVIHFQIGVPDLSQFPRQLWAKLLRNACFDAPQDALDYLPPEGLPPLRQALAAFLLKTKGLRCRPEQIMVVSGSAQGLAVLFQAVARTGRTFIIEDPVFIGSSRILKMSEYPFLPIPVDEKGMQVEQIPANLPTSGIIVTPSHQFPLGSVLPIQRRVKLIEYARAADAYIIENDYDSEFRHHGSPISTLHLLDPERVLHVGSFSEILCPAIRLGYIVVPDALFERCRQIKSMLGLVTSSLSQLALNAFIRDGYFDRHFNKMKKLYRAKRKILLEELTRTFGDRVSISGDSTGLYVVAAFDGTEFTAQRLEELLEHGVQVSTVEESAIVKGRHAEKLLLGYGNLQFEEITTGVQRLAVALE